MIFRAHVDVTLKARNRHGHILNGRHQDHLCTVRRTAHPTAPHQHCASFARPFTETHAPFSFVPVAFTHGCGAVMDTISSSSAIILLNCRTNPAPQGLDFLGRLAAAGVLGDAEAGGDRIRKIEPRG